jgi:organic radical activating enzyme
MNDRTRSYYCSVKFRSLKIDLESHTTYNCHASAPHDIDFEFVKANPGQLFNTPINVREREQMLVNERNASCEQNCWTAEDRGAVSARLMQRGTERTHIKSVTNPEIIDLTIGGDCNLTCSYCCKEFSNAWRRDILKNGDYQFSSGQDNRFVGNAKDQFLVQLKQADLKASDKYQLLLDEIRHCAPGLKKLIVTGGEPFLDNFLEEVIESLPLASDTVILIYTGLGVAWSRFQKILDRIKSLPNLKLIVSAENTDKFLEFNRYGIDWPEFDRKIQYIKHSGIDFTFQPTITNLTVFGFLDFYKKYSDHFNLLSFAYQPRMMAVNVLDDQSKHNLEQQFSELPIKFRDELVRSMKALANDADRQKISEFLKQYVERRPDLDLGIYPLNFLQWLKLDHVVQ